MKITLTLYSLDIARRSWLAWSILVLLEVATSRHRLTFLHSVFETLATVALSCAVVFSLIRQEVTVTLPGPGDDDDDSSDDPQPTVPQGPAHEDPAP